MCLGAACLLKAESFADRAPAFFWGSVSPHPPCVGRWVCVLPAVWQAPVGFPSWLQLGAGGVSAGRPLPSGRGLLVSGEDQERIRRRASPSGATWTRVFAPESVSSHVKGRRTPTLARAS